MTLGTMTVKCSDVSDGCRAALEQFVRFMETEFGAKADTIIQARGGDLSVGLRMELDEVVRYRNGDSLTVVTPQEIQEAELILHCKHIRTVFE